MRAAHFQEIVVLDPNLRAVGSHHFQYDVSIAHAAEKLGIRIRFFGHRQATSEAASALPGLTPIFADAPALPPWLSRWLPRALGGLILHVLAQRQRRRELAECVRAWDRSPRLVLVPERTPALDLALASVLHDRWGDGSKVVLVFHYPPSRHITLHSLRTLRPLVEAGHVFLAATNEPLAERYEALFGHALHVLPWPLALPLAAVAAGPVPERPGVQFLVIGGFRMEKGVDLLAQALEMLAPDLDAGAIRFVIQGFPNPKSPEPEADRYFEQIQAFAARHPGVRIVAEVLDPQGPEYWRLYRESDVLLLPYQEVYATRISAVLMEGLALGKPAITTAGTCMARQIGTGGAGLVFPHGNARALADAIREMAVNLPRYSGAARRQQDAWNVFHNPENYVRTLERLTTGQQA